MIRIGPSTGWGHPTGGAGRWSSPLFVFMLNLYNGFYTYCYYSNMVV